MTTWSAGLLPTPLNTAPGMKALEQAVNTPPVAERFDVERFGASATASPSANTTAINAAAKEAAAAGGVLFLRPGANYPTNDTITATGHIMAAGARLNYSGTGIALQFGTAGSIVEQATCHFPRVVQTLKTTTGWSRADTGIRLVGAIGGRFVYGGIDGFATGLALYGEANGCDYNTQYLGTFTNNKVGLLLDGDATVGYCNENVWIGGRFLIYPDEVIAPNTIETGIPGTRYITLASPGQGVNNHRFYGTSLEGHAAEYVVENRGSHNYFDRDRWETDATRQRFLLNGPNALYTRIFGGYDANKILFTFQNGAGSVEVQQQDGLRANTAAADGHLVLHNANGGDTPSLMIVPDAFAGATANLANYQVRLSDASLKGKLTGDASPRLTLDFTTGQGSFGSLAVGNATAATTPGAVVKKVPLVDQAGTLLGYLPVYSSIT